MLANSNLSLISPKSTANTSSTGSESSTSSDSFDNVFQQVSDSLTDETSTPLVTETDGLAPAQTSMDLEGSDEMVVNGKVVIAEGGEGEVQANLESGVLVASAETGGAVDQVPSIGTSGLTVDGTLSSQRVNSIEGAIPNGSPVVSSAATQVVANSQAESNQGKVNVSAQLGQVTSLKSNEAQVDMIEKVASQEEVALISGNSLQAEGGDVANTNESGQTHSPKNESTYVIAPALVATAANEALDSVVINPSQLDRYPKVALGSSENTKPTALDIDAANDDGSIVVAGGLLGLEGVDSPKDSVIPTLAAVKTEEVGLSESALSNLSNKGVDGLAGEASLKTEPIDLAAGLALIGAGSTAKEDKPSALTTGGKLAVTSSPGMADIEGEKSADLDWIMQQMGNENQIVSDATVIVDSTKLQAPMNSASQASGQNIEQVLKQAGPLSLGLATAESGLVETKGQIDVSLDADGNVLTGNKLDGDSLKQVENNSAMRVGGSESIAVSSTSSSAALSGLNDAKLGLAVNTNNTQNNITMQVPPTHPNWSSEMGEKVMWMNKQGIQQAEIHLDPPELGSLTVKVSVDADVATVSFVAASAQVKELLEGQVQRLREMMAQQGVELAEVDVNVSQQEGGSQQSSDSSEAHFAQQEQDVDSLEPDLALTEARVSRSKVDFYA